MNGVKAAEGFRNRNFCYLPSAFLSQKVYKIAKVIIMKLEYSEHWIKKQKSRPSITAADIEYAIINSAELRDKHWPDALNAITRVPPSGRILKVVYKRMKGAFKVITAFWLD